MAGPRPTSAGGNCAQWATGGRAVAHGARGGLATRRAGHALPRARSLGPLARPGCTVERGTWASGASTALRSLVLPHARRCRAELPRE
eukprot:15431052-Alexandrium_andersonii.AAC.1